MGRNKLHTCISPKASDSVLVETLIFVVVEEKCRAVTCWREGVGDLERTFLGDEPIKEYAEGCLIAALDRASLACGSRSGPRVKRSLDVTGRIMAGMGLEVELEVEVC
jgi:hypothetical protein